MLTASAHASSRPAGGRAGPEFRPIAQLEPLRSALMALVTQDSPDLTARQMAVLLTVVQQKGPHTVRGLAAQMRIPKPSTTRAIDVLQGHKYVTRTIDPSDRRSVLIDATEIGRSFLLSLQPAPAKEMAR